MEETRRGARIICTHFNHIDKCVTIEYIILLNWPQLCESIDDSHIDSVIEQLKFSMFKFRTCARTRLFGCFHSLFNDCAACQCQSIVNGNINTQNKNSYAVEIESKNEWQANYLSGRMVHGDQGTWDTKRKLPEMNDAMTVNFALIVALYVVVRYLITCPNQQSHTQSILLILLGMDASRWDNPSSIVYFIMWSSLLIWYLLTWVVTISVVIYWYALLSPGIPLVPHAIADPPGMLYWNYCSDQNCK